MFIDERHRERERQRRREKEKQAPCREPDAGLDPGSPGSRSGLKAGAKPLSHPGIPVFRLNDCLVTLCEFTYQPLFLKLYSLWPHRDSLKIGSGKNSGHILMYLCIVLYPILLFLKKGCKLPLTYTPYFGDFSKELKTLNNASFPTIHRASSSIIEVELYFSEFTSYYRHMIS